MPLAVLHLNGITATPLFKFVVGDKGTTISPSLRLSPLPISWLSQQSLGQKFATIKGQRFPTLSHFGYTGPSNIAIKMGSEVAPKEPNVDV